MVSTTRPELLAACVGVTAHPDDERYKSLFGKYAVTPGFFSKIPIFPSVEADPDKGTGILMVCTFGDQTDVMWWREQELELRQIMARNGRISERLFGGANGWFSLNPDLANINYQKIVGKRAPSAKSIVVDLMRDPENSAVGKGAPLQREPEQIQQFGNRRPTWSVTLTGKHVLLHEGPKNFFVQYDDSCHQSWRIHRPSQWNTQAVERCP